MATGWVKSLQCKSRAFDDVYLPNPKHLNHLIPSSTCRKSYDIIESKNKKNKKNPRKTHPHPHTHNPKPTKPAKTTSKPHPQSCSHPEPVSTRVRRPTSDPFFPTLTELPEGHPSRNVVEIIFHTSWSSSSVTSSMSSKCFSGRVEMLFKVQNPSKTVARFEEYREIVKSRAVLGSLGRKEEEDVSRCIADGNEVMRFYCLGPTAGAVSDVGGMCMVSGKDGSVCTFSGSGGAHENAGGGKGRRAMLVCRVIAGRVGKRIGVESFLDGRVGFDSVSGENGELLVFDSRAVLPCFLIVYKL